MEFLEGQGANDNRFGLLGCHGFGYKYIVYEGMESGREDLNLRPPAPEAGALAGLRYAPFLMINYTFSIEGCQINFNFASDHRGYPSTKQKRLQVTFRILAF